ncbi:hypothetical protein Ddye_017032 [Dipteronia dyeriana]|uniref:Uncharacterized protein n=1 Tax=Dipteronia dyeriana TaxID=168575 RepID=A0AAD9U8H4_9ROSI|nr:hypothetical protein Ddye_017032 [Dipteronia dyeriana]
MEVNKSGSVGVPKPEKKKPQLNLFVGGGGGLVLLGGGMAVAALVAAFTVIKNKHHTTRGHKNEEPTSITPDDNDNVQKRDAIASPGPSFVLQTPTTVNQNSCGLYCSCTSTETSTVAVTAPHIDSCELVSTHNLVSVTENKPVPIIIADGIENPGISNQQILTSNESSEESITSGYDIIAAEEFTLPAPDGVPNLDEPETMIENDSVESFEFIETDQVKNEDEALDAEELSGEENLPLRLVEEEDDDGVYVENVVEKAEENPERKFAVEEYWAMQEILLSDDSDQESIALGNDMYCSDNSSLAVPDGSFLDIEPENIVNNYSGENVQFTETIEVIKEEEAVNTDKLVIEENSPTQSIADQEENSCVEQVIDKEEENPEEKLAVEENLLMQSVTKEAEEETQEETVNDSNEEHASEIEEEGSQGKLAEEVNLVTQSVEEEEDESEDDDDDDGDDSSEEVTEEEEDSSEGTGSSSMDSNVEAVWPAEMIDAPSLELKELSINYQNLGDKIGDEEDRVVKTGNHDLVDCKSDGKTVYKERGSNNETTENTGMMLNKKAAQELVTMKDQTAHSPKGRIWIWSMLVLVFLLLLLHIRRTAIPHDLPYHDSVIVA